MGRSAATDFFQALTDAFLSVTTLFIAFRFGSIFYKRFLSRENVRNQYVLHPPLLSASSHSRSKTPSS